MSATLIGSCRSALERSKQASHENYGTYQSREHEAAPRFTPLRNPFLDPRELLDDLVFPSTVTPHSGVKRNVDQLEFDPRKLVGLGPANHPTIQWWLIHTKPRQEKKLAEELRRLAVPHFLPVTACKSRTRGRSQPTLQPLFAGYLFLMGSSEQRLAALKTNRVVATMEVADQSSLTTSLWNLAHLIEKEIPLRREDRLQDGERVRVKAGLLKDYTGTIIKRGNSARLFVRVTDLLGGVSVEISNHLLEPF